MTIPAAPAPPTHWPAVLAAVAGGVAVGMNVGKVPLALPGDDPSRTPVAQIGWADALFRPDAARGVGVGDDAHGWACDGVRMLKWNDGSAPWGKRWAVGDVVCVGVDLEVGSGSGSGLG